MRRPVASADTMSDESPKPTLDSPLVGLSFSARVWNLIERRQLTTLRDIVALAPSALLTEKNFGRTSIADLRAMVESVTGQSWEEARAALLLLPGPGSADGSTDSAARPAWDRVGAGLDERRRALPLREVDGLPTRMASFAALHGIATLGALFEVPVEELRAAPNLGRKSIADTLGAVAALTMVAAQEDPAPLSPPTLDDYADMAALWQARLGAIDRVDRIVLQHRSGFGAPLSTLAEVGEMLGFSRERARQIEVRGLRAIGAARWWIDALDARVAGHLADGARALGDLAALDPWLAPIRDERALFALINDRFLDGRYAIVRLGERECLARFLQEDFDRAAEALDEALVASAWPSPRESVDALIDAHGGPLGRVATEALRERANERLAIDPDDATRIAGYGGTRPREILLWLKGAGRPVTVGELAGQFGRGRWPDEIVFVDRGLVTVPELLDGFAACTERVASRCVARMTADGPDRQWSCHELAEALRREPDLPAWFGPWPLSSLLRRSEAVRYLGRGVVALPHVEGDRMQQRALLVSMLEEAGGPLTSDEIRARAGARRSISQLAFDLLLQRAPFVETARDTFGLLRRDVPGGAAAVRGATDGLVAMLASRGCGLSLIEALHRLRAGGEVYEAWSETMLRSVCLHDLRLQTSSSRAVGLAEWEGLRIPTRREVIAQALVDGGGRAEVAALRAKIEALYGEAPSRHSIAWSAWHTNARLDGEFVVPRDPAAQSSRPPPLLEGVPDGASSRFEALLTDSLSAENLATEVEAHVRRFFLDAVTNDAIDLSQVVAAQRACNALLARTAGAPREQRRLAEAAVRYFVLSDDGAWDFTANGLDDDLAILRAVAAKLDAAEA